jgi:phosphinothricin acetyltransferase
MGEDGSIAIRPMQPDDWPAVRTIYAEGIATGIATFETQVPEWTAWNAGHREEARLVAADGARVVGFFAIAPYSGREVYRGVAWESVYVATSHRGRGIGRRLLEAGIAAAAAAGCWTLLAGVIADNHASLEAHARAGFRQIGVNERFGRDASGAWRDVVQLEWRATG